MGRAVAVAAAVTVGLTGSPAQTATATAGSNVSVTLALRAPQRAQLHALVHAAHLTRAQRLRRLRRVLPDQTEHDDLAQALSADGLRVTGQTAWTVTATGPPAAVDTMFGRRPTLRQRPTGARFRQATGALPTVPSNLRALVTAAYLTTGGPKPYRPLQTTTLSGTQLRDAYTAAGVAAPSGTDAAGEVTVATLQLSNWSSTDLATYAATNGLSLDAGQYTAVPVDGGARDSTGDLEVALDQESILATAPHARQRAYFAPNTDAGYLDALSQVLDDVTQDSHATDGGDPSITALAISWGGCEAAWSDIAQVDDVLASLTAAGVTVFAAAGDSGIYDCAGAGLAGPTARSAAVDFPASSPYVVGVGGTTLSSSTGEANNGSNWTETAWSCTDLADCLTNGGSGGGASSVFSEPSWQTSLTNSSYAGTGHRLVPDIAADADPNTGFVVYTSDPTGCGSTECSLGGTSLSAPVAAALLTNTLAAYDRTRGVGDIHAALYAAATSAGTFRDVTTGSNGASTDAGTDPSTSAGTGYDTVSGLGGALWPALVSRLLDLSQPPTVAASLVLSAPHSATATTSVTANWSVTQTGRGAGGSSATVTIQQLGSSSTVFNASAASPVAGKVFTGNAGVSYRLTVTGIDAAGNTTATVTRTLAVPIDDRHFTRHGQWRTVAASRDIGGTHTVATASGAYASVTAAGRTYYLYAHTGPRDGRLAVFVGGHRIATVDLYTAAAGYRLLRIYGGASTPIARRTLTLRYTGTKNQHAASTTIDVDGLLVAQ